jgi:hypothetical protein
MTTDRLINILVTGTCIEMMVAVGLGVPLAELTHVAWDWQQSEGFQRSASTPGERLSYLAGIASSPATSPSVEAPLPGDVAPAAEAAGGDPPG